MSRTVGTLTVIFSVVVLVGSAGAPGAGTSRNPIRIDAQVQGYESCTGKFLLSLGSDLDAGKTECHFHWGADGRTPEGLSFSPFRQTLTFIGKLGTIDIVSTGRTYDLAFGELGAWDGTWKIVKGTDAYAGLRGSGIWKGAVLRARHSFSARYAAMVSGA